MIGARDTASIRPLGELSFQHAGQGCEPEELLSYRAVLVDLRDCRTTRVDHAQRYETIQRLLEFHPVEQCGVRIHRHVEDHVPR